MAKIVVVDDEYPLCRLICRVLGKEGHEVHGFDSALDALGFIGGSSPELIITDIHMPGLDGMALLGAIRRVHPTVPVLAMSGAFVGSSDSGHYSSASELGAISLPKPFEMPFLVKLVAQLTGDGIKPLQNIA